MLSVRLGRAVREEVREAVVGDGGGGRGASAGSGRQETVQLEA